jgi:hypothetical protein
MKNNFVATFILLAVGLIFNDVASVEGKPTKGNPYGWQGWQVTQVNLAGTDAVFKCYGTFSNYREPQQCNKADRIKGVLANGCDAADPIACQLLSNMVEAENTASLVEASKGLKSVTGG